jgi:UDP-N-acetylglucosamine 4,6-dehydratase/5-epimerase
MAPDLLKKYGPSIEGTSILITGGTGSFGVAVTKALLPLNPKRIVLFSRDEKKQFDLGNQFVDKRVQFVVGDVRDKNAVDSAMNGIDYVFHAAALKQVPTGEFFPMELVKTNVLGSNNVLQSAIEHDVKRVVVLSTDKACAPINVMGMTKALMERLMIAAARRSMSKTIVCGTRYGNVLYTRGSVVPYFIERIREGKSITVTDPNMTRFIMTLDQSIDLVLFALTSGKPGEMYVRKAPAATVQVLAEAVSELFNNTKPIEVIGIRPGEKGDESLIAREEIVRASDEGDYFRIVPEAIDLDYRDYYFQGFTDSKLPAEGYTSSNTTQLAKQEVKDILMALPEFKEEVNAHGV